MKHLLATILTLATILPGLASEEKQAAVAAALAWLEMVDAGDYAASWDAAAPYFQAAVPKADWERTIKAVREPLGETDSRQLRGADFKTTLPGAPDGEYFVIQFNAKFAHKASAVETITPMKAPDGTWRVSGYFIK